MTTTPVGALAGTTVVDLTEGVDGPYCTKLLADLGARVIKVEKPLTGDRARSMGPFPSDEPHPEQSAHFLYLNANKESVTLDVTDPDGQAIFRRLAGRADLVVESFAPGTMESYGLGYEDLARESASLVVSSITPFGQYGPHAHWKGPDIVRQAMSGWLFFGGVPERPPLKSGASLSYYVTGVCASAATLAALAYASETGLGQHVDVSAQEAFVTCAGQEIPLVGVDERPPGMGRPGHHGGLPFGIFPCQDGIVGLNILFQPNWLEFCEWAEMQDLLQDPRYDTIEKIRTKGSELDDRVTAWTMQHDRHWILWEGQKRRIATTLVPTMPEIITLEQHVSRGFIEQVEPPDAPPYSQPGHPWILSATPWRLRHPAPRLGSSNAEVYGALGYDVSALGEQGII